MMYSEHSAAVAAPPQRRRRPAFSCNQCRRRKIKCDHNKPCNQCQRSKGSVCSYGVDINDGQTPRKGPERQELSWLPHPRDLQNHVSGRQSDIITPDSSTPTHSVVPSPQSTIHSNWSDPAFTDPESIRSLRAKDLVDITNQSYQQSRTQEPLGDAPFFQSVSARDLRDDEQPLRGCRFKMKLFGESHWMNYITQFDKLCLFMFENEPKDAPLRSDRAELGEMLQKCKIIGRTMKSARPFNWLDAPDYKNSIPSREVCDELIGQYLRTFEFVHRILHIPSFQQEYAEYWDSPQTANTTFIMKLLLVMAIGTIFSRDQVTRQALCSVARQWVYIAQSWLSAPLEKSRMNLSGLQVQCLLLLARQTISVGADMVWISAGSVLRTAMQMGYHRDPTHYPGISVLHAEMRRRLWATILEMVMQTAFDTAMPPLISLEDFDTEPPSNLDDIEITKTTRISPAVKPLSTYTQTSLQIILSRSMAIRLEACRVTTNFRSEPTYDTVLRISTNITNACRESNLLMQSYLTSQRFESPELFHTQLVDFLTRRFLLNIHRPFAMKARSDPRYYFSRKISLDTAVETISYPPSSDWTRLLSSGSGFLRELSALPGMTICLELIMQLEEETTNPPSPIQAARAKATREPLIQLIRDTGKVTKDRVKEGEMNVKGDLFVGMALGQIEAMERGSDIREGIMEGARKSVKECYEILKSLSTSHLTDNSVVPTSLNENPGQPGLYQMDLGEMSQDLGFDFLDDGDLNFEMPDSWLYSGFEEDAWFK